jgi:predicted Zn-dependent peptidase
MKKLKHKKFVLKNGLRVIIAPQKETKAVAILFLVGTGSKYETKKNSGISHLLEHSFFLGTRKFKNQMEISKVLDEIGSFYSAFTGEEQTGIYAYAAANHTEKIIDWISELFFHPLFPTKAIEKEKGVIISEINMYLDNPRRHIYDIWKDLLYGDQPAGWDIAGTIDSVSKIKRKDILDYFQSQYVAKNIVICVAGNIKEGKVLEKIKKSFSKIKKSDFKQRALVKEEQKTPQIKIEYKDIEQANIALGVRAYNIFHKKRYALEILSLILGGMMSSRMFKAIREKLGTGYDSQTSISLNSDTGFLTTFVGVDKNKTKQAISAILKEYKKIKNKLVSQAELKKVKNYIKGQEILSLESCSSRAIFYANQELSRRQIIEIEDIFKKIDKVTAKDVQDVAKEIFVPEKLNLAIIGKFKNQDNFRKLLKI